MLTGPAKLEVEADWAQVGAEVAAYQSGGAAGDAYEKVTIERMTATRIVTSNGDKWRVSDRKRIAAGDAWSPTLTLLPLSDPAVQAVRQRRIIGNLAGDLVAGVKGIDPSGDLGEIALTLDRLSRDAAKAAAWCRKTAKEFTDGGDQR